MVCVPLMTAIADCTGFDSSCAPYEKMAGLGRLQEPPRKAEGLSHDSLPFNHSKLAIDTTHCYGLGSAAGPLDLQLVHFGCIAQTEVQGHIVLRSIAAATDHILSLSRLSRGNKNFGADCVARTLVGDISH